MRDALLGALGGGTAGACVVLVRYLLQRRRTTAWLRMNERIREAERKR